MSRVANWSYTSIIVIKPFLGHEGYYNQPIYGEPYEILGAFKAETVQARDNMGAEFVGRHTVWTEDTRPKYLDRIVSLEGIEADEEIRSVTADDAKMLLSRGRRATASRQEKTDFRLVTA